MSPTTIDVRRIARLVALASAGALVVAALVTPDDDGSSDVTGVFADASPLEVGSEVRAAGVKVGEVSGIELAGRSARVSLDVEDAVLPLHADARMVIRPINLLGENYVELVPGDPAQPALRGDVPLERTSNAVTLQGLLDTFDAPTSTGLAALLAEAGEGFSGSGAELAAAIKALGPAMQEIDRLGDVLRAQNRTLSELLAAADPVARAVAGSEGRRLDRLVEQTRRTLVALAAQQQGIEQTVAELPSTLVEARRALASLDRLAGAAAPTLRSARPVTRDLEQISREINEFSRFATPAFGSFEGVYAEADRLIAAVAPIVRALRRAGPHLVTTSRVARRAGDELLDQHLGDLMAFVRKWALSTNGRDNISHYFRGVVHVTPESLNALLGEPVVPEVLTPGGDGDGNSDSPLPDVPGVDPDLDLDETLDQTLDGVGGLLGGTGAALGSGLGLLGRSGGAADPTSATGLTASQEQQLLGQLLGGRA